MGTLKKQFEQVLTDAVSDASFDLARSKEDVALYMVKRTAHLAAISDEPGFDRAVIAERNSVALYAGISVAKEVGAFDARVLGAITGALRIGVLALL